MIYAIALGAFVLWWALLLCFVFAIRRRVAIGIGLGLILCIWAVSTRGVEPGFNISSVSVTNVPCCDGRMFWYQPDEGFGGYNVRCCRQVTLTWPTVNGKNYRVLMRAPDKVTNLFGVWNIISVKLPGTGGLIAFTTGAPEVVAFYTIEQL